MDFTDHNAVDEFKDKHHAGKKFEEEKAGAINGSIKIVSHTSTVAKLYANIDLSVAKKKGHSILSGLILQGITKRELF